jgi:hypothetical protein
MQPCKNGCGWSAFKSGTRQYDTCCTHCKPGGIGRHAHDCATKNQRVSSASEADAKATEDERLKREAAERANEEDERSRREAAERAMKLDKGESARSDSEYSGSDDDQDFDDDYVPDPPRTPSSSVLTGSPVGSGSASPSSFGTGSAPGSTSKPPRGPKSRKTRKTQPTPNMHSID